MLIFSSSLHVDVLSPFEIFVCFVPPRLSKQMPPIDALLLFSPPCTSSAGSLLSQTVMPLPVAVQGAAPVLLGTSRIGVRLFLGLLWCT
jgi:hypothetical protein